MRGVRSLLSQTRAGATSNADGAANADGERAKAPTLSAFGYLTRVTETVIGALAARALDGVPRPRRAEMYIGIGTVVVIILILILLRLLGVF